MFTIPFITLISPCNVPKEGTCSIIKPMYPTVPPVVVTPYLTQKKRKKKKKRGR